MKRGKIEDSITKSIIVKAPRQRAFEVFVNNFNAWWPAEYTWSQDALEVIAIEPKLDGRCYELGPNGFHCDWGRVIEFDAPNQIVFTWQISLNREPVPDASKSSMVKVDFVEREPVLTEVVLEHHSFSRHGDNWEQYLAAMGSPQGWSWLLDQYALYVN